MDGGFDAGACGAGDSRSTRKMMKLVLRDRLAEWCLAALANPAAEPLLEALVAFARRASHGGLALGLSRDEWRLLDGSGLFERSGQGLRLRREFAADLDSLRRRAARFAEALAACRSGCGPPPGDDRGLPWMLCAAAALFNARLFFEVHELLENCWRGAEGDLKTFLQGLIQVAVGLHHQQSGNLRGAIALLDEGNAKLARFGAEAYGWELREFREGIVEVSRRLRALRPAADLAIPRLRATQTSVTGR
jgi:predicted metal-dependent hydrolase